MTKTAVGHAHDALGFTLVEVMITVSILGVLMAIALPSFNELIKNNRRTVVVNELVSSLMLARAEAAKRGQAVSLCANTKAAPTTCVAGTDWDDGFLVFLDSNGNGAQDVGEAMLKQFTNAYPDIKVLSKPGPIVMKPFNQISSSGDVEICDSRGPTKARAIILSANGRARVSEKDSGNNNPDCNP